MKEVAKYGKVYTGSTPPIVDTENYGQEFMFVSPGDLGEMKFIEKTEKRLSKKGFNISRIFPKGSVLFTCIGSTIGKSGIATESLTSNQQINAVVVNEQHSNEFLYYQLEANTQRIRLLAGEQAVPILNKSQFESIKILTPPLPEQRAIAAILATQDRAIAILAALIQQKEQRKKWLMQRLLTGKMRLAGFAGAWREYHLGDMFLERNETKNEGLPLLSLGQNGVYPQSESEKRDISNDDKSKYKRICVGDIGYNTMRMWQGRSALSSLEGIVSPAYTIVKAKATADPMFFAYLFKTPRMMNLFWRNSQGLVDDTLNCKFKDFSIIKLHLPDKPEQTAIAQLLSLADREIEVLKKQAAAQRARKKWLMQVLLTGRRRVKILNEHG